MILAWLGAAFVAGVVTGTWLDWWVGLYLGLTVVAMGCAFLVRRSRWKAPCLVGTALFLGFARAPTLPDAHRLDVLAHYNGMTITVLGIVTSEPDVRATGQIVVIRADQVMLGQHVRAVSGSVEARLPRGQAIEYGDRIQMRGRLLALGGDRRRQGTDSRAWQGIRSSMYYPHALDLGPTDAGWRGWVHALRHDLERGIDVWLPEPEAALLIAIALGAKSASLGDLAPVLVATGLIHIIAISGIKVALFAGMLHAVARRSGSRIVTLLLSESGLGVYVVLTGATASGERSALMWTMVFVAAYLGRTTVPLVSIACVSALMVAVSPGLPWDIGFQMSVIGTLSIITFSSSVSYFLRFLFTIVREAVSVTLTAQAGTLPIVMAAFHLVSVSGLVANALVLPLLPALILLGFLLGLSASVTVVAAPVAGLAYAVLHVVIVLCRFLATLPAPPPTSALSPFRIVVYYLALSGLGIRILRRANWVPLSSPPRLRAEMVCALALALCALTVGLARAGAVPTNQLIGLHTGASKLLRLGNVTVLIDGGPQPFTLLEQLGGQMPFNDRIIDLVMVTDPSAKNVLALRDVVNRYRIGEVLDVGAEYPSTTYAAWREDLRARGIRVRALRTGVSVNIHGVAITALAPDAPCSRAVDCEGILRLTAPRRIVLLLGTASLRQQDELLFRGMPLAADDLVVDSPGQILPSLLRSVHPSRVVHLETTRLDLNQ